VTADFVSLADLLRGRIMPPAEGAEDLIPIQVLDAPAAELILAEPLAPNAHDLDGDENSDIDGAVRDARLFRARLADALDDAVARLVRDLAADVLARELRLAPCELAALVRRVLDRAPVVRVRVAPADVARVRGVPVLADPALTAGDAIVELASGALDARLGVRLAAVLEAFA
jgi:hypothetical protein